MADRLSARSMPEDHQRQRSVAAKAASTAVILAERSALGSISVITRGMESLLRVPNSTRSPSNTPVGGVL